MSTIRYTVMKEKTKRLFYPLSAINILNAVVLILSQFFGWYYYIDSNNIYHRGAAFLASDLYCCHADSWGFLYNRSKQKKAGKKQLSVAYLFGPPIVGIVLQVAFYGISIVLNSVVLSLMVVFVNLQNHSAYTDYLTGVSNRKKLDFYLKKKKSACRTQKTRLFPPF